MGLSGVQCDVHEAFALFRGEELPLFLLQRSLGHEHASSTDLLSVGWSRTTDFSEDALPARPGALRTL